MANGEESMREYNDCMSEYKSINEKRLPEHPLAFGDQDENGVDLSLIRELLKLSPVARLRRMDRATTDALRVRKYAREQR